MISHLKIKLTKKQQQNVILEVSSTLLVVHRSSIINMAFTIWGGSGKLMQYPAVIRNTDKSIEAPPEAHQPSL